MKVFHCDHCDQLLFFENTSCINCRHRLAYLPELTVVGSLEPAREDAQLWRSPLAPDRRYRLCRNYTDAEVCNWAVDASDPNPLCLSCRLTTFIPDVSVTGQRQAWYRLEAAKRRLVFTLLGNGLPVVSRVDDAAQGLAFEFKADPRYDKAPPVLTGHANGVITINIAEADDAEREKRRTALREPYRTLLGHFRHESGHYYWDRLLKERPPLDEFRDLFGDERRDYRAALEQHYERGAPAAWPESFVTAYASAHPWEDWAETWAHYVQIADTLEMAAACGLSLRPGRPDEPALARVPPAPASGRVPFDRLIASWFPLTYVLNNLNRGLGLPDGYPFILSGPAVAKLRFVHKVIQEYAGCVRPEPEPAHLR